MESAQLNVSNQVLVIMTANKFQLTATVLTKLAKLFRSLRHKCKCRLNVRKVIATFLLTGFKAALFLNSKQQ